MASELAASHLAIVDYISPDRDSILISYTSEPIVAEAAASLMQTRLETILCRLESYFRGALINTGARSEYIGRLVLVLAADKVASRNLNPNSGFTFNQVISCNDYLNELVGDQLPKILKHYTEDMHEKHFYSRFLNGKIFFTHFISCCYTPTLGDLVDFFKRGAAVLCKTNEKSVDMIIPVLLPPSTTKDAPRISSKLLERTTVNIHLIDTAEISKHDDYDIPEPLLPYYSSKMPVPNSQYPEADPNLVAYFERALKIVGEQTPHGNSPKLPTEAMTLPTLESKQQKLKANPFMVSSKNMSFILVQVSNIYYQAFILVGQI